MADSQTSRLILAEIKKLMRQQRLTYRDIAPKVGLTESGLKKLMTGQDCSVGRLEKICRALDVQLLDVIRNLDRSELRGLEYREEQEAYFESNHTAFLFYWLLVYERRTVEDASKVMLMTEKAAEKIVLQLDKLNLVMLLPSGEVRVPQPRAIAWVGKSNFVRRMFRTWSENMVRRVAKPDLENDEFFMIHYVHMTDETWADFLAALRGVQTLFVTRAAREMRLKVGKRRHARWILAADRRSFVEEELL